MALRCGNLSNRRGLAGCSYCPTVLVGPLSPGADSCSTAARTHFIEREQRRPWPCRGRPPAHVCRLLAASWGVHPCFQVARPQLWSCRKREPRRQPSVRKTHLACRRHSVCHRPPVCQDRPRMATLFPTKDLRGVPASSDAIQNGKTRRLFRRRIGRGYQPRPRTMGHCLAARFAGLPAASTEGTLPSLSV